MQNDKYTESIYKQTCEWYFCKVLFDQDTYIFLEWQTEELGNLIVPVQVKLPLPVAQAEKPGTYLQKWPLEVATYLLM